MITGKPDLLNLGKGYLGFKDLNDETFVPAIHFCMASWDVFR
jgi:hypothetical protein